jgi:hypothetical protein
MLASECDPRFELPQKIEWCLNLKKSQNSPQIENANSDFEAPARNVRATGREGADWEAISRGWCPLLPRVPALCGHGRLALEDLQIQPPDLATSCIRAAKSTDTLIGRIPSLAAIKGLTDAGHSVQRRLRARPIGMLLLWTGLRTVQLSAIRLFCHDALAVRSALLRSALLRVGSDPVRDPLQQPLRSRVLPVCPQWAARDSGLAATPRSRPMRLRARPGLWRSARTDDSNDARQLISPLKAASHETR